MTRQKQLVIDKRASRFTVRAFAGGVGAGLGYGPTLTIGDFWGEAQFDPVTLQDASLWVKMKAASIMVAEEMREEDRQHLETLVNQEILKTSKFPEVSFLSLKISPIEVTKGLYRMDVAGELTLNGVTRPHGFAMQVSQNQHDVRAYGDFSIRQSDYDIPQVVIAGGMLQLQDELRFCFYILAKPQGSILAAQDSDGRTATKPENVLS